jgi:hypothetical protein
MVGRLAAQVLRGAVRDGEIVGIGDGASVSAMAEALEDGATPSRPPSSRWPAGTGRLDPNATRSGVSRTPSGRCRTA